MKITVDDIKGEIIKDNEAYLLEDNIELKHLTVSKTTLHPDQNTRGHSHLGLDEVYHFISGTGTMRVGDNKYPVKSGSIVLIPNGDFHQVFNDPKLHPEELIFIAIFEKYDRKEK